MNNRFNNSIIVVFLLMYTIAAYSQSKVYKYVDENGKTVYTSVPPNNTNNIEEIDLQDANTIPASKTKVKQKEIKKQHDNISQRINERISARKKRDAEIKATRQDIANKKEVLEKGIEPLPGERIGTSGILSSGSTRFTQGYHDRVKNLENELQAAEDKLKQLLENK